MELGNKPLLELSSPECRHHCSALHGVELTLERGEAVAVSGPPGTGKTMLLRMAAGLEPLVEGRRSCRAERIGFVFQTGGLVSNLSIHENISLPLTYRRYSVRDAHRRTDRMIERFGLEALQHERPAQLSAEERRLCQLARAAALNVDLLLLDELFLRLSAASVALADDWLEMTREEAGTAVLMVSLLESSIRPRADRWIELEAHAPYSDSDGGS